MCVCKHHANCLLACDDNLPRDAEVKRLDGIRTAQTLADGGLPVPGAFAVIHSCLQGINRELAEIFLGANEVSCQIGLDRGDSLDG